MPKEVKDTFTSDDDEDSTMSQYKDMYMDQAIELVADEVVDQVGENYTQQLYEQMKRNLNMTEYDRECTRKMGAFFAV